MKMKDESIYMLGQFLKMVLSENKVPVVEAQQADGGSLLIQLPSTYRIDLIIFPSLSLQVVPKNDDAVTKVVWNSKRFANLLKSDKYEKYIIIHDTVFSRQIYIDIEALQKGVLGSVLYHISETLMRSTNELAKLLDENPGIYDQLYVLDELDK